MIWYKNSFSSYWSISLVVAPAALVFNWGEELARFAPQLKVSLIAGSQSECQAKLQTYSDFDVLVTSYDLLKRDIDQYEEKEFLYQIIDEAQYIKNHTTAAGATTRDVPVLPSSFAARRTAITCKVFPSPISSARIPPNFHASRVRSHL